MRRLRRRSSTWSASARCRLCATCSTSSGASGRCAGIPAGTPIARIVADTAAEQEPLPAPDRARLTEAISQLTAAQLDSHQLPEPVDPGSLDDPRAIGLAVKLSQMVDDLAPA